MNILNNLGTTEIVIIAFILLVLFGQKKLMEWAKGLGESGREIKKVKKEFESTLNDDLDIEGVKVVEKNEMKEEKGGEGK
ncbi:hypothetical protein A3D80_02940 [Candidatus Roizmanbacteria bacterium RIFCSPHIGHO2_02_FULL_40_13b]|uniref:Sec-independent protein translocase protein TatA n=1 Tax=Candidatus Roizmanbacteria bacterium RIFCSPHIGHO2_01_FULL_39_24 TaxID=1802032 RepID=A0A1F7GIJ1_9BACT|nr:MAG: hypothetical protein A2799_02100 [Candidatus Roizmanbacteria bacterium RIFCSPHIGHO2_01_FULL_39_24]OGK27148.1 MAG: hypothetical protein A3D80_02940 [Candidatus Roizmanbacteria bacterium RIFCSPHIGHO2_02_FULL_40_13b]OGK49436.1 MAG: hypothetical protein A3A56_00075 [Candidatus Roizmanbacteria bacterium RIFCSPLOWO2_01_FULL_40_32]OGK57057.1 MAG: hypothetical protein A3H83_03665 [Candidatus Roizmanbacteria bacterium RIFCSPLOWO2_02_FULL_39_8]